MKVSRFSEQQIALILKQVDDGLAVDEVCRKAGVSQQTYYRWRKKYGGLMPSEVRRLKQLEEENRRLKQMVADLSLDKAMLQDVLSKMYGLPRPCKFEVDPTTTVCLNVSGLSRVSCGCSQAMMRSARLVPK